MEIGLVSGEQAKGVDNIIRLISVVVDIFNKIFISFGFGANLWTDYIFVHRQIAGFRVENTDYFMDVNGVLFAIIKRMFGNSQIGFYKMYYICEM